MADVEVQMQITTERKVRKVKKTSKRRESQDGVYEEQVTVVESSSNDKENLPAITHAEDNAGYAPRPAKQSLLPLREPLLFDPFHQISIQFWFITMNFGDLKLLEISRPIYNQILSL